VLLLRANTTVAVDLLVDSLWPGPAPPAVRKQLQNGVGRLRRTLVRGGVPPATLETRPDGYLLRASPEDLDALSFARQVEEGRRLAGEERTAEAAARLRAALALWRGMPLADLNSHLGRYVLFGSAPDVQMTVTFGDDQEVEPVHTVFTRVVQSVGLDPFYGDEHAVQYQVVQSVLLSLEPHPKHLVTAW
jgi:hypothetical protein